MRARDRPGVVYAQPTQPSERDEQQHRPDRIRNRRRRRRSAGPDPAERDRLQCRSRSSGVCARPAVARRDGRSTATRVGRPRALYRQQEPLRFNPHLAPALVRVPAVAQAGSGSPSAAARARQTAGGIPVPVPALGAVVRRRPRPRPPGGHPPRATARRRARRGRRSGPSAARRARPPRVGPTPAPGRRPTRRRRPSRPPARRCRTPTPLAGVVQQRRRAPTRVGRVSACPRASSSSRRATASDSGPVGACPSRPTRRARPGSSASATHATRRVVERTRAQRLEEARDEVSDRRPRARVVGPRSSQHERVRGAAGTDRRGGRSTLAREHEQEEHEHPVRAELVPARQPVRAAAPARGAPTPSSGGIGRRLKSAEEEVHHRERERDPHRRGATGRGRSCRRSVGWYSERAANAAATISNRFVVGPGERHDEHVAPRAAQPARVRPARAWPNRSPGSRAARPARAG